MRVAFDVQGTLNGPDKILELYKWFRSKGCEMVVWSGMYSYATDMADKLEELGIPANEVTSKVDRDYSYEEDNFYVDVAIDDRDFIDDEDGFVSFLSCKHMIPVHKVPEDPALFEEYYGKYFK